jgi:hypothetical protein
MTAKWCPGCRREIPEPPVTPTTTYAKFWRDNLCYFCDSRLRALREPPQSNRPDDTSAAASALAEPPPISAPPKDGRRSHDYDDVAADRALGSRRDEKGLRGDELSRSDPIGTERDLEDGARATALRRIVRVALEKQGWLKPTPQVDDRNTEADHGWRAEQVELVAFEASKAFPGRDWQLNGADDQFEEFIDLAVMNRQSNRLHSFANSAELFLAGHRGREYRAGYNAPLPDKSGYVLLSYGLCLVASAPVAAFIASLTVASGLKRGTAFVSSRDFQDFVSLITSCALFLPLAYMTKRVRILRGMPAVAPKYLPMLVLLALVIFVEYRLVYDFSIAKQLGLPSSMGRGIGSLLDDARNRWLYSGTFVVISLALLQYSRFIGRLIPEEIEYSDELASALNTGVVTVISVIVSAIIKLLLVVAS